MHRKIIHLDADCFYCAVEIRDDPSLSGLPVAVGGQNRGVIATCSYEARKFGIHSAMASTKAKQLCPELIILPPDMPRYRLAAQQLKAIFLQYTPLVESVSLDEAYLDVSRIDPGYISATEIAKKIRAQVESDIAIRVSAGVSINRFLAKVASDWRKPNGLMVVTPDQVNHFVANLPIKKIPGVGAKTQSSLHGMGIYHAGDIRLHSREEMIRALGKFGSRLYDLSFGIDERPVVVSRIRKSISVERTFPVDLTPNEAVKQLPELISTFIKRAGVDPTISAQFVKLKFSNFKITSIEQKTTCLDLSLFATLLKVASRRSSQRLRLVGLGVKLCTAEQPCTQPDLFAASI